MDFESWIDSLVREHLTASLAVMVATVVALVLLVWKLASLWFRIRHLPCDSHAKELEDLQKTNFEKNELPCQSHAEKIESHAVSVGKIEATLTFLAKSLDEINTQLRLMNNTNPLTQQHSPLRISPRGMEVVKKLGMDRMFNANWERIRKLIDDGAGSKNAYDINDFCIKHAVVFPEKFLTQEELNVLKNDAYTQGLTLTEYMKIIAVMARDRYFEENGIRTEDTETT